MKVDGAMLRWILKKRGLLTSSSPIALRRSSLDSQIGKRPTDRGGPGEAEKASRGTNLACR
jgi:hypothetical protein